MNHTRTKSKRMIPGVLICLLSIGMLQATSGQISNRSAALIKAPAGADAIKIPFESYKLANGLTVILSVDKAIPTVVVNIWYHVGSKNEAAGRTGFAHLFEHMMFTGSAHAPYPLHDKLTGGIGGLNNGSDQRPNQLLRSSRELSRGSVMARSHAWGGCWIRWIWKSSTLARHRQERKTPAS